MMPLYREDMADQRCSEPGCNCGGRMFIHSNCHTGEPMVVSHLDGIVTVQCHKCGAIVIEFFIASKNIWGGG